jgi:putative ABC transport system substrate-binding protein
MIFYALGIVLGLASLLSPDTVGAQQTPKVSRVGILVSDMTAAPHMLEAFRRGLREVGWVEGRNLSIEYRGAEGKLERLPALAAELVALPVDVIMTAGTVQASAAKQATRTVPIVFATAGDPVASGLVASLARPGGNVTGLSSVTPELVGKRLELLKQALPGVTRVAVLWRPGGAGERIQQDMLKDTDAAARTLGIQLAVVEAREPVDLKRAFVEIARARVGALTIQPHVMFLLEQKRLVALAAQNKVPTVYPLRDFADAGGLMAYAADDTDLFRRAATYVDKILRGARPDDLPVEQATKFELVINTKTAKALRLTIPSAMLSRADQVIGR